MSQLLLLTFSPVLYSLASQRKHIYTFTVPTFSFPSCGSLTPSWVAGSGLSLYYLVSHVPLRALCAVISSWLSELAHCW